jgi:hypothetical protein
VIVTNTNGASGFFTKANDVDISELRPAVAHNVIAVGAILSMLYITITARKSEAVRHDRRPDAQSRLSSYGIVISMSVVGALPSLPLVFIDL